LIQQQLEHFLPPGHVARPKLLCQSTTLTIETRIRHSRIVQQNLLSRALLRKLLADIP
jgi:hypothetical protein